MNRPRPLNLEKISNPQLVAKRRDCFRSLAKAKLFNLPNADVLETVLTALDKELTRRNLVIQNPELI